MAYRDFVLYPVEQYGHTFPHSLSGERSKRFSLKGSMPKPSEREKEAMKNWKVDFWGNMEPNISSDFWDIEKIKLWKKAQALKAERNSIRDQKARLRMDKGFR